MLRCKRKGGGRLKVLHRLELCMNEWMDRQLRLLHMKHELVCGHPMKLDSLCGIVLVLLAQSQLYRCTSMRKHCLRCTVIE